MSLRIFLSVLLMFSVPPLLRARLSRMWTDEEIFEKADLIVIATVVSTKDTKERTTLPDIKPANKVSGVETEFQTRVVLKGKKDITRFRLHHYKSDEQFTNGPLLIVIPKGEHPTYLLFLTKETDGRYAPATDQTDPAREAVLRLWGANGVRGEEPDPQLGNQWSYEKMVEKAELVVKADWVSTKNTDERSTLPDTDIKVIGVTSEFEIHFVLKGPSGIKKIELHHYKFQDEDDAFRYFPPQLIRIVPPVTRGERQYPGGGEFLLFLTKEPDGRYAPVTGQADPAVSSVLRLIPALY